MNEIEEALIEEDAAKPVFISGPGIQRMSASVVGRQITCHASANLSKAIPNWTPPVVDRTANNAANRGSDMHDILDRVTQLTAKDMKNMAKAIDYVADLRALRRFKVLTEAKVKATWLKSQPETTVDVVLYVQDEIHVIDWKTGKIPVYVQDNEQLLYYGACFAPLAPKAKGINLHIVQPWADNIDTWFADTNVVAKFMADAQAAEAAIQAGDVSFMPSDHCKFCVANPHSRGLKGAPLCPAAMQLHYPKVVDDDAILSL